MGDISKASALSQNAEALESNFKDFSTYINEATNTTLTATEVKNSKGETKTIPLHFIDSKNLLRKMVHRMVFQTQNNLVVSNCQLARLILNDKKDRVEGILTDSGVYLVDYFIQASEENSSELVKRFGLQAPVYESKYFLTQAKTKDTTKNSLNIKDGEYSVEGKTLQRLSQHPNSTEITKELSADGLPIAGKVPGFQNAYFNIGYGPNVFNQAFGFAECLRKEIHEEKPCLGFSIDRFKFYD